MGQYNATAILRDEQVAQEIRSMAALGKFPKEITVYGLVYYCDDERKYMISADSGKLIAFLNETAGRGTYLPGMRTCRGRRRGESLTKRL